MPTTLLINATLNEGENCRSHTVAQFIEIHWGRGRWGRRLKVQKSAPMYLYLLHLPQHLQENPALVIHR
jgi:hypothetical protein